jgi:hypothetical protein
MGEIFATLFYMIEDMNRDYTCELLQVQIDETLKTGIASLRVEDEDKIFFWDITIDLWVEKENA